jgi:hypothetical protein
MPLIPLSLRNGSNARNPRTFFADRAADAVAPSLGSIHSLVMAVRLSSRTAGAGSCCDGSNGKVEPRGFGLGRRCLFGNGVAPVSRGTEATTAIRSVVKLSALLRLCPACPTDRGCMVVRQSLHLAAQLRVLDLEYVRHPLEPDPLLALLVTLHHQLQ